CLWRGRWCCAGGTEPDDVAGQPAAGDTHPCPGGSGYAAGGGPAGQRRGRALYGSGTPAVWPAVVTGPWPAGVCPHGDDPHTADALTRPAGDLSALRLYDAAIRVAPPPGAVLEHRGMA